MFSKILPEPLKVDWRILCCNPWSDLLHFLSFLGILWFCFAFETSNFSEALQLPCLDCLYEEYSLESGSQDIVHNNVRQETKPLLHHSQNVCLRQQCQQKLTRTSVAGPQHPFSWPLSIHVWCNNLHSSDLWTLRPVSQVDVSLWRCWHWSCDSLANSQHWYLLLENSYLLHIVSVRMRLLSWHHRLELSYHLAHTNWSDQL